MNKRQKKKLAAFEAKKKVKIDKESVKKLSDEELNKAAGGLWCEPGCDPVLNGCYCDGESDW